MARRAARAQITPLQRAKDRCGISGGHAFPFRFQGHASDIGCCGFADIVKPPEKVECLISTIFWWQNFDYCESKTTPEARKTRKIYLLPNGLTAAPEKFAIQDAFVKSL